MIWTALSNIKEHAFRSAGAVSALAMVVVFALTSVMSNTTVSKAAEDEVAAGTLADVAYTAPDLGGIPVDLPARLQAAPGVESAVPVKRTTVLFPYTDGGQDRVDAAAALVLGPDASAVVDLGITSGSLDRLTGPTIAVADGVATVGAGKRIILGDGTQVSAVVVATYRRELGFGPVAVSPQLVQGHTTDDLDSMVLVSLEPEAQAPPVPAGVEQHEAAAYLTSAGATAQSWVNSAALAVLLGYVLISVANRLVATMTKRRSELRTLQLIGATRGQLLRMVRLEAFILAAIAVAGGLVLATIPLALLGYGYLGTPWASGPWWLVPAIGLLVFGISWTALEAPARRLLRHRAD
jgi:putative ABC transport system permease protein